MIKIQLYNRIAGSLTVTPDAQGTEDFDQTLKRSDQTDGVVYEYNLDLKFNKQARAYLRDVFRLDGGIEAVVIVNAFEYRPNAFRWEQIGTGTVKYINSDIDAESFKTSMEQTGFVRKVINLMEKDLDLETLESQAGITLPATAFIDLTLHSKAIIKETTSMPGEAATGVDDETETGVYQQLNVFSHVDLPGASTTYREQVVIGQIDTSKADIKELEESFALTWGYIPYGTLGVTGPASVAQYEAYLLANKLHRINMTALKEGGTTDITIRLILKHEVEASDPGGDVDVCGDAALGTVEVHAWYEQRDKFDNIIALEHIGEFNMPDCGARVDGDKSTGTFEQLDFTLPPSIMSPGDKLYVYTTHRVYGDYDVTGVGSESVEHHFRVRPLTGTFIKVVTQTKTTPSTAKAYLVFEALERTFQYYSDQVDCFRSNYFDRTDRGAAVDGPGSLRAILSGANIRKVVDRTTFVNGRDFHAALNAIDCLGLGFEFRGGKQVVVVEPLPYFYNKNSLILDLGPVSDLHLIVDSKQYSNQIELAYGKIDIQKTNGIDEPNTQRRFNYPITQVSTKYLASTKYKTSGYEIEDQRRLVNSTEDSKNDDNNFFIDLVRDGLGFKPTTTEGYTLIQNLFDPDSSYNLNLSPRRNLDNHLGVVAISLYLSPTKEITFASGEGNYLMVTQKTGEAAPKPEGGLGVKVSLEGVAPLFLPERYKFACPLSSDQMAVIRGNPYGYFKFQEYRGGPDLEGYLSKVTRDAKKKLGTFELLKVFR